MKKNIRRGLGFSAYAQIPDFTGTNARAARRREQFGRNVVSDFTIPRSWLPARINRHTGAPHEHKQEIARRLRQQASVQSIAQDA